MGKFLLSIVLTVLPYFILAQSNSQSILGQGFDIRYVDAINWSASSKGQTLIKGGSSSAVPDNGDPISFHFVTNPYEFEEKILQSNANDRPYLSLIHI